MCGAGTEGRIVGAGSWTLVPSQKSPVVPSPRTGTHVPTWPEASKLLRQQFASGGHSLHALKVSFKGTGDLWAPPFPTLPSPSQSPLAVQGHWAS